MATMTDIVTDQVRTDADEGITLKSICTTECLRILESRYNKSEPIVLGTPTVRVIPQGHKVSSSNDEPIGTNWSCDWVTGDMSLPSK